MFEKNCSSRRHYLLHPMLPEEELIQQRKEKLKWLKANKISPYAHRFDKKDTCKDLLEKYKTLEKHTITKNTAQTAGRLMSIREMGKASFAHLQDFTGKIQIYIKEETNAENYQLFKKLDMGDIIGISGAIFTTKTGEVTI